MKEGKAQSADERKPDKPETTEVIDPERLRTRIGASLARSTEDPAVLDWARLIHHFNV